VEERDTIRRRLMEGDKFTPYATLFKLEPYPDGTGKGAELVACLACNELFLLTELLSGELEEDHCPHCGIAAGEFWKGKPHLEVP